MSNSLIRIDLGSGAVKVKSTLNLETREHDPWIWVMFVLTECSVFSACSQRSKKLPLQCSGSVLSARWEFCPLSDKIWNGRSIHIISGFEEASQQTQLRPLNGSEGIFGSLLISCCWELAVTMRPAAWVITASSVGKELPLFKRLCHCQSLSLTLRLCNAQCSHTFQTTNLQCFVLGSVSLVIPVLQASVTQVLYHKKSQNLGNFA